MTGYLIVIAMLTVALIAVLVAFLIDHDEIAPTVDEPAANPRQSEIVEAAAPTAPVVEFEDEGTNDNGATSV